MTRIYIVASYYQGCLTAVEAHLQQSQADARRRVLKRECNSTLYTVQVYPVDIPNE